MLILVNHPLADRIVNAGQAMGKLFALACRLISVHHPVAGPNVQLARIARRIVLARITSVSILVLTRVVKARHVEL